VRRDAVTYGAVIVYATLGINTTNSRTRIDALVMHARLIIGTF